MKGLASGEGISSFFNVVGLGETFFLLNDFPIQSNNSLEPT